MRKDLAKVLVERPRTGGQYVKNPKYLKHRGKIEEAPSRVGMSRRSRELGYDGKELSDNLQPLKRMLKKWVGRSWDKFYSELCQVFDKRKTMNAHIFGHLMSEVNTSAQYIGGKYYEVPRYHYGGRIVLPVSEGSYQYYVDRFHILREVKKKKKQRPAKPLTEFDYHGKRYALVDGIWYEYTHEVRKERDYISGLSYDCEVVKKRQLSSNELKMYKIQNEKEDI